MRFLRRQFLVALMTLFGGLEARAGRWADWCEKYLVAEDPYQYMHLDVDALVRVYHLFRNQKYHSKVLLREMRQRLAGELSPEDREILTKTLANE